MQIAACRWVALLLVIMVTNVLADTPAQPAATIHPHIEVGASYLYAQVVKGFGSRDGTYWPRLDGFGRDNSGGLMMEIAAGPKKETVEPYIQQLAYDLPADGCVVDVVYGIALLSGAQCTKALPVGGWIVRRRNAPPVTCRVTQPQSRAITVPAGTFNASQIICKSADDSTGIHLVDTYWYAADTGAMVKVVHEKIDSAGNVLASISEELHSYERGSKNHFGH